MFKKSNLIKFLFPVALAIAILIVLNFVLLHKTSFDYNMERILNSKYSDIKFYMYKNVSIQESLLVQDSIALDYGNENIYVKTDRPFVHNIIIEDQLNSVPNNKWRYEIKINNPTKNIKEYILKYKDSDILGKNIRDVFPWINIAPVVISSIKNRIEFDKKYLDVYITNVNFDDFVFVFETEPFIFSENVELLDNNNNKRQTVLFFPLDENCEWCMKSSIIDFEINN